MCGIAGIYHFRGQPDEARLQRAAQALQHRGPDGQNIFCHKRVGLAHTRLAIVDPEGGDQPLHSADQRLHLVANGEIYNDPALRERARQHSAAQPLTGSDCESILQVYQQQGIDGFKQLHGMFGFALYDEQTDDLLLVRDRLGIKPLFYARTESGLAFASELKGLLPLLDKVPDIGPQALSGFLDYQFHSGKDTIFQQVRRVLPGQCLQIRADGQVIEHQYWSALDVQPQSLTLDEAIEAFEPLFHQVMREHLRSDVPLGLFLSGGIDSSVLLAELADTYDQPLRTYSIGFTEGKDELQQANALAEQFGTVHTPLILTHQEMFERIVHMVWATDDLMRDYACLPLAMLSDVAAQDLKVVFSGEGGDEAFAGYRRYVDSLEGRLKALVFGSGGVKAHGQWSAGRHTARARNPLLRETSPRDVFRQAWADTPENWSRMQKWQYVDLTTSLPDNLLVKSDRILMAHGLEGRVPFSDHRLVEFGLSLPDEVKYQQRRGKYLIRRWAEKVLPAEHLQLPKRGFHVPVAGWLSGTFLDQLEEKLLQNKAVTEWFEVPACRRLFAMQRAGKSYSREIWGLMQFAIWHGLFVEGRSAVPATRENPLDWL
ncbi:MAG: asparagine synthase (glutamine-hydrolyzing) [Thiolinea sp.]